MLTRKEYTIFFSNPTNSAFIRLILLSLPIGGILLTFISHIASQLKLRAILQQKVNTLIGLRRQPQPSSKIIAKLPIRCAQILNIPNPFHFIKSRVYITQMLIVWEVDLVCGFATHVYFCLLGQLNHVVHVRPFDYRQGDVIGFGHVHFELVRSHLDDDSLTN